MRPLNTIVQYRQWDKVVKETKDQPTQDTPGANANDKKNPLQNSNATKTFFMLEEY